MDLHLALPAIPTDLVRLFIIYGAFAATFFRILGKDYFWVIDDIDGIARFSERWIQDKDAKGEIIKEYKQDSYEIDVAGKKKTVKYLSFIPELGFPGCFLRFIRLHIGKKYQVLGTNKKGHDMWGYHQSPRRHHLFSMAVQVVNLTLGYFFLKRFLNADTAFGACLLYAVYPLTTQTVAWISGVSYSLSMVFALATLLVAGYLHDPRWVIPLTAVFSFLSGIILYIGCFTWILLAFLGFKWAAFTSALIGFFILFWKGTETKNFRVNSFKEQNMAHTTSLNWRKPIVMLKTFWYYLPRVFLPTNMGLYHEWGYFYEDPIERVDKNFWGGLLTVGLVFFSLSSSNPAVRLSLVWFLSFFFLFTNFVTAQQFVADRYAVVPAFGICTLLASLLYPTPLFWVLLGLYAMRTFCHLPTFKNEIDYYLSNFLNFRKSEVALGNLGVSYMNQSMPGAAVDMWMMATRVNPHYDVSWYNLYSIFRANGRLQEALDFLKKVMDAKIVHFEDKWREELLNFENQLKGLPANGKDIIDQANEQWRKYGRR